MTTAAKLPPGPRGWRHALGVSNVLGMRRDMLGYLGQLQAEHGDVVFFRFGHIPLLLLTDPELIRRVLVTDDRHFTKGRALKLTRAVLGNGLLTSEGHEHLRQRRMIQPAFYRPRLQEYAQVMTERAAAWSGRWTDGQRVDMADEMRRVALSIVTRTLFGTEAVDEEFDEVLEALAHLVKMFRRTLNPFARMLAKLPLPSNRRYFEAKHRIDATMYRLIEQHRAALEGRSDLMARLIEARDDEAGGDGGAMTDEQVRDEVLTLFAAGHETTALALTWTWYLLDRNPDAADAMRAEIGRVLGGRPATFDDMPRLEYTRRVLAESMRLRPPAYAIGRMNEVDYPIGHWSVPRGTTFFIPQYLLHRDPRWFDDPLRFDPDRWKGGLVESLPPCAYMPFGGGPRVCIGEGFAWAEATIVLATLAQRWAPELVEGHRVQAEALITLRPRGGLPMIVREACSSRPDSTPVSAAAPST